MMLWETVKSLAEVQVRNIHCSPLTYLAGHGIIGGYQFRKHVFSPVESTPATADNLLFFHYLGDDIRSKLLHHLYRRW